MTLAWSKSDEPKYMQARDIKRNWRFNIWCSPQGHKLLTKDAIHFFVRRDD